MKRSKKIGVMIFVLTLLIQLTAATYVDAATTKKKTSNNNAYVNQVSRNGGLVGIPAKIRKNPKATIARWHFCRILKNLFDGRIQVAATWIDEASLNQLWACGILTTVSSQLGRKVSWGGGSPKAKVNLGIACKLIVLMINQDARLRPTKWS